MAKGPAGRKRARRWTREEARAALSELKSSGLTLAAFARSAGIHPQRLHTWRQRLGEDRVAAAPVFVEVHRRALEPIEVVLRSGVVLRVSETVDVRVLRRIADALSDELPC
ncbi:MAG: transposase [Polyangiaceae bacterium]|jgi:transposase-like protein|nr:transposase [Polyangiaceae bacterium]